MEAKESEMMMLRLAMFWERNKGLFCVLAAIAGIFGLRSILPVSGE